MTGSVAAAEKSEVKAPSRVALTAGNDRADNVFRGLRAFQNEIARTIGDRRVVIKPNNVAIDIQLSATHADCLEDDLKKIEIVGEPIARHIKTYKLAPNIEQQLIWMKAAEES